MGTKVYDANEVTVNFAGLSLESGFDDGEFVRVEQEGDDFVDKIGSDGEVTRSKTNDQRTTVTIILMQSSEGNAKLSALRTADLKAGNGAGVAPLLVRDRQGTSLYAAAEAWIMAPPEAAFGREPGAREWRIRCASMERVDGGN